MTRWGCCARATGRKCVFPPGFTGRDGEPIPIIVRKRDGGFGYAATDLAAVRHRATEIEADPDAVRRRHAAAAALRDGLPAARQAGWIGEQARSGTSASARCWAPTARCSRPGPGDTIKLIDLLDEAVSRAAAIVAGKSPQLDAATQAEVARAVGIGAVKYADLSSDRVKDYVFDWDRMLRHER